MTTRAELRSLYAGEYQWLDGITDAILKPLDAQAQDLDLWQDVKCRDGEATQQAFSGAENTLGFNAMTAVWEVWQTDTNREPPQPGYQLDIGGDLWAIHSVVKSRFGYRWDCLCSHVGPEGVNNVL